MNVHDRGGGARGQRQLLTIHLTFPELTESTVGLADALTMDFSIPRTLQESGRERFKLNPHFLLRTPSSSILFIYGTSPLLLRFIISPLREGSP